MLLDALDTLPRALIASSWPWFLGRLALGGLLLAAGLWKTRRTQWLHWDVENRLPRPAEFAAARIVLPTVEVVLGLTLLFGLQTRAAAIGASFLLAAFSVFGIVASARGLKLRFSCAPGLNCRPGAAMVIRNLGLTLLAAGVAAWGRDPLMADHWLRGLPAGRLGLDEAIPAVTIAVAVFLVGRLLGPILAVRGREMKLREVTH